MNGIGCSESFWSISGCSPLVCFFLAFTVISFVLLRPCFLCVALVFKSSCLTYCFVLLTLCCFCLRCIEGVQRPSVWYLEDYEGALSAWAKRVVYDAGHVETPRRGFHDNGHRLMAVLLWGYYDHPILLARWFKQLHSIEMVRNGDSPGLYDGQKSAQYTRVGTFAQVWWELKSTCAVVMMGRDSGNIPCVHHKIKVESARKLWVLFQYGVNSSSEVSFLLQCDLIKPKSSFIFFAVWKYFNTTAISLIASSKRTERF